MPHQDNPKGHQSTESSEPSTSKRQRSNISSTTSTGTTSEGKKVPKWFNMGEFPIYLFIQI